MKTSRLLLITVILVMTALLSSCGKDNEQDPLPNLDALNGCQKRRLISMQASIQGVTLNFGDIAITEMGGYYNVGGIFCICGNRLAPNTACRSY